MSLLYIKLYIHIDTLLTCLSLTSFIIQLLYVNTAILYINLINFIQKSFHTISIFIFLVQRIYNPHLIGIYPFSNVKIFIFIKWVGMVCLCLVNIFLSLTLAYVFDYNFSFFLKMGKLCTNSFGNLLSLYIYIYKIFLQINLKLLL